jgi:hypothetical protein
MRRCPDDRWWTTAHGPSDTRSRPRPGPRHGQHLIHRRRHHAVRGPHLCGWRWWALPQPRVQLPIQRLHSADGRKQKHVRWGEAQRGARTHTGASRTGGHLVNVSVMWGMVLVNYLLGSPSPPLSCSERFCSPVSIFSRNQRSCTKALRLQSMRCCYGGIIGMIESFVVTSDVAWTRPRPCQCVGLARLGGHHRGVITRSASVTHI